MRGSNSGTFAIIFSEVYNQTKLRGWCHCINTGTLFQARHWQIRVIFLRSLTKYYIYKQAGKKSKYSFQIKTINIEASFFTLSTQITVCL